VEHRVRAASREQDKEELSQPSESRADIAPEDMIGERASSAVRSEQLRILFAQAPIAIAVNLIVAVLMAAALAPVVPRRYLVPWLGAMFVTVALRGVLWRWYGRAAKTGPSARAWEVYSVLGAGVTGALWGIGGALLFPDAAGYQMFIALTIAGMSAGAVGVNVPHFPTVLAFIVTAVFPMAVRFAAIGTTPDAMLAGMMVVFAVALIFAGLNFNRSLVETVSLRIDLARNARALEATNSRLRDESRQRRAAEDMLRRVEKLDALGHLTGGLAHDFNNLLQIMIGNLDLLKYKVTNDEGVRLLAAAHDGAERAANLTHSLLAFARDQQLGLEVEDLNAIVEDFSELLHDAVGENARLEFALGPRPLYGLVDTTHFQTAVLNLVLNAGQALPPEGGRIAIETRPVALGAREAAEYPDLKPGSYVMVAVSDTGTGMSPEVMEHAFEPFYTTKEIGKGSGLGLSQVYGFALQSGGSVALTSRPNEGTTVRMLLPAADEPARVEAVPPSGAALEPAASAVRPDSPNLTVLVVEDEPAVRTFMAKGVGELGYRVLTAPDGPSALRLVRGQEKIDLIFSDIMMPNGIRGDELAKEALKLRPRLKVLLTSGYSARPDENHRFPFLQKPFSYRELAQTLDDVLAAR
jgi:signal transduction histidine kinase